MKNIKYFIKFLLIIISFVIFKLLGVKFSSNLSGKIFEKIGPFFRSKRIIQSNIKRAFPNTNLENIEKISKSMWNNYGRIFAEYIFIKDFRSGNLSSKIEIDGEEILKEINKSKKQQVVFISGHLGNFELMVQLENLGLIYVQYIGL